MNELQIFNNPEFGELRTFIEPDGRKLVSGTDVAKALGYTVPRSAVKKHCRGGVKWIAPSPSGNQMMTFITEGDVYRLIYKAADQSNNPEIKAKAER